MKTILFWFFCLITYFSYSQVNKINYTDSLGLKQGYWIEYDSLDIEGINISKQLRPDSFGEKDYTEEVSTKYEKIKHYGGYLNNKKNGLWVVSKRNNETWIKVFYANGEIIGPIYIYYPSGKLLYLAKELEDNNFEVKEYDKHGNMTKQKKLTKSFISKLGETKLFVIGYNIEQK